MYERSAIVLERYMEKILEFNKEYNLKKNNENYNELIHEIEDYQIMTDKELKVIQEFDDTAEKIENLQREEARLYKINRKLEDDRTQLFKDLGEDAKILDTKFKKIEYAIEKNNEQLKEIREEFVKHLSDFSQKQKDRNKCEKERRIGEANHIEYIKRMHEEFEEIEVKDVITLKDFVNSEKEQVKQEALAIMTKNGKNERVAFDQDVLRKAVNARIDIAEKEAECYVLIYDRMKKLLAEIDSETIKTNKHKKVLRDTSVKLAFLKAQKEYIVGFLDYERMTAISGTKAHKKMMVEACNNFELYMMQIKDLYELILKEVAGKATKKAYKELYNKTYLRNIEDKEKNFEEEVNHVNISVGTVINSNYWRIEGIRNIYNVFQEEVSEKFEKDLSEYRIEEVEEIEEEENDYQDAYKQEVYVANHKEEYEEDEHKSYLDEDYKSDKDNYTEEYEEDEYKAYLSLDYEEDDDDEYKNIYEDDDDEYDNIYEYRYDDEYDDEYEDEEEDDDEYEYEEEKKKQKEDIFDEEDIDAIIKKSRKKAIKNSNRKDSKGLFNKWLKKDI